MTHQIDVYIRPKGSLGTRASADYARTTRRRLFKLRRKNIGPRHFREHASGNIFYLKEDLDNYPFNDDQMVMEFEDI